MVQQPHLPEVAPGQTREVRPPDFEAVAEAVPHGRARLALVLEVGVSAHLAVPAQRPQRRARVHVGDEDAAGLARGHDDAPRKVGLEAPDKVLGRVHVDDGLGRRGAVGVPVPRQQRPAPAGVLPRGGIVAVLGKRRRGPKGVGRLSGPARRSSSCGAAAADIILNLGCVYHVRVV